MIKGDGFVLYSSPLINKTSRPIAFNVDISGFDSLTIEWSVHSFSTGYLHCCLGNINLYYDSKETEKNIDYSTLPISLSDLKSITSESRRCKYLTDKAGNTYNSAIFNDRDFLQSGNRPIFEYLLDSRYRKFECTLYIPDFSKSLGSVAMIAIADGIEVYRSPEMTVHSEPIEVEIDLSGCNDFQITFTTDSSYDSASSTLCLANAYLYLS